jgi:hypothetical protein
VAAGRKKGLWSLVTGHGADHIVLPEGVHNGHAAFAIVATISLFTRCTVPLPAPTIVASQRMPFQAAQVLPDGVLDLWGHLGRQELPALLAHTLQPGDEHCAIGIRLIAKRPPGRGVEDGETFEQAAILLEEETGIRVKDVGVEAARREVVSSLAQTFATVWSENLLGRSEPLHFL